MLLGGTRPNSLWGLSWGPPFLALDLLLFKVSNPRKNAAGEAAGLWVAHSAANWQLGHGKCRKNAPPKTQRARMTIGHQSNAQNKRKRHRARAGSAEFAQSDGQKRIVSAQKQVSTESPTWYCRPGLFCTSSIIWFRRLSTA